MSLITIEENIFVKPQYLDQDILEYIKKKISNDYIGICNKEYGYITNIIKDKIQIKDNIVSSSTSDVFFKVAFQVKADKPEIGSEYEGVICLILQYGIFVKVFDKMKVLIPSDKIKSYKFNKTEFIKDDKKLRVGDKLKVKIEKIKFEKQNFDCIGNLKE